MPKHESDPEDPLELCGVGLFTEEDTSELMTECLIEEFMRLGHGAAAILALFRNPQYTGANLVCQNRGEAFVKARITEVFGWWNRPVSWNETTDGRAPEVDECPGSRAPAVDPAASDPMGAAIPRLD